MHIDAVGGFNYYDSIFKVGDEFYKGTINIKVVKNGFLFKDLTQIENITQNVQNSYGKNPKFLFLRDISMEKVSQQSETVNAESGKDDRKWSVKDTEGNTLSKTQQEYFKNSKVRA